MIEFKGVTKKYDHGVTALDNIDLIRAQQIRG